MASKTSFFNKTIYVKNLKRFFPWGIGYAMILFLGVDMAQILSLVELTISSDAEMYNDLLTSAMGEAQIILAIFIPIAAIFAGVLLFSYLFSENSANMFHALPIRREAHLGSAFAAGMTLLSIPLILAQGIMIFYSIAKGFPAIALLQLKLLGVYLLGTFIFFGICTFCAMLAGRGATMVVLYIIFMAIAPWIYALLYYLKFIFMFGMTEVELPQLLLNLSPIYCFANNIFDYSYPDYYRSYAIYTIHMAPIIGYTICAVVLLVLAVWLYKKRAIETSGDMLAFPVIAWPLQAIVASFTGFLLYAVIEMFITLPEGLIVILLLLGGLIGFFAARMLIRKKFFIFKESIRGAAVYAVLFLVVIGAAKFDIFGLESKVPTAENVVSVTLSYDYEDNKKITDPDVITDTIRLHQTILDTRDDLLDSDDEWSDIAYVYLRYELQDGSTLMRSYTMSTNQALMEDENSAAYQYYALVNQPEVVKTLLLGNDFDADKLYDASFYSYVDSYYEYEDFTDAQLKKLAEAIFSDIADGNILYTDVWGGYDFSGTTTTIEADLTLYILDDNEEYSGGCTFYLNEKMTHTIEALEEMGIYR